MHDICRKIRQNKQWPHEWTKVIFVPLPKAGDLKECINYRNVSLICHASRVTLCIILNQLRQFSERELPEEQAGFRVGRGTRYMLFILQLVIEKTLELEEKEVYMIFVDYSKAFDKVHHRMLFETTIEMGNHTVPSCATNRRKQEAAVRWNGQLTDWFQIGQGTRQGCNVSPTEFNIYGENIIRRVEEKNKRGIGGRRMTNLRYADDTTIISSSASGIRKYFQDLVTESKYYNIEINVTKTKVMVVSRQEGLRACIWK